MLGSWELENLDRRSRHPNEARSKFERWVLSAGGTREVSRRLGVHQVTVSTWTSRRAMPELKMAAKILKEAKGELTLDDIIEGTLA